VRDTDGSPLFADTKRDYDLRTLYFVGLIETSTGQEILCFAQRIQGPLGIPLNIPSP
jgi:hypothetical protein